MSLWLGLHSEHNALRTAKLRGLLIHEGANADPVLENHQLKMRDVGPYVTQFGTTQDGRILEITCAIELSRNQLHTVGDQITAYCTRWPDAQLHRERMRSLRDGRTYEDVLKAHGIDMEDVMLEALWDPKIRRTVATQAALVRQLREKGKG